MIIYQNVKALKEVYSCYAEMHPAREMEDKTMLIVTFYQNFDVVRSTLTEKGIDVTKHRGQWLTCNCRLSPRLPSL